MFRIVTTIAFLITTTTCSGPTQEGIKDDNLTIAYELARDSFCESYRTAVELSHHSPRPLPPKDCEELEIDLIEVISNDIINYDVYVLSMTGVISRDLLYFVAIKEGGVIKLNEYAIGGHIVDEDILNHIISTDHLDANVCSNIIYVYVNLFGWYRWSSVYLNDDFYDQVNVSREDLNYLGASLPRYINDDSQSICEGYFWYGPRAEINKVRIIFNDDLNIIDHNVAFMGVLGDRIIIY